MKESKANVHGASLSAKFYLVTSLVLPHPVEPNGTVRHGTSYIALLPVVLHVVVILVRSDAAPGLASVIQCDACIVHPTFVSKIIRTCSPWELVHAYWGVVGKIFDGAFVPYTKACKTWAKKMVRAQYSGCVLVWFALENGGFHENTLKLSLSCRI